MSNGHYSSVLLKFTGHKTHIVVILNRLIRIQNQPDPDDTFNMIFMGYIQLQYLTTCSIINSLLWVYGGEGHTSESGTGHTIRHGSFILIVNWVCNTGEGLTTRTYICDVRFSSHESNVDLASVRCPSLGCYPLTGGKKTYMSPP
jgi:hypothetical protein